jgi:hypothetical protein
MSRPPGRHAVRILSLIAFALTLAGFAVVLARGGH